MIENSTLQVDSSVTTTLSGALSLTKSGAGTLALSNANSGYSGNTTVSAGTLNVSNSSALGTSSLTLQNGTTLGLTGGVALTNAVSVTGDPTFNITGANSMSGIGGTGDVVVLGTSDSASTDVLTLTTTGGTNTYSGTTTVGDGTTGHAVTLKGGAANAFSSSSATTVTANSLLDLGGYSQTIASLAGAGTAIVTGDLETIAGVRDVAAQVNALGRFDAVIHNAAVGYREGHHITADGLPHVFAINTLAAYILTALIERPQAVGLSELGHAPPCGRPSGRYPLAQAALERIDSLCREQTA